MCVCVCVCVRGGAGAYVPPDWDGVVFFKKKKEKQQLTRQGGRRGGRGGGPFVGLGLFGREVLRPTCLRGCQLRRARANVHINRRRRQIYSTKQTGIDCVFKVFPVLCRTGILGV